MNLLVILLILLLLGSGGYCFGIGNHQVGGGASVAALGLLLLIITGKI